MCKWGDTVCLDLGKPVAVDRCIAPFVELLNTNGMPTVASCCGHGWRPGNIALRDGRELMIARHYWEARYIDGCLPIDIHGHTPEQRETDQRSLADRVAADRKAFT